MTFETATKPAPSLGPRGRVLAITIAVLAALLVLFLIFTSIYTDLLWFRSVNFTSVFTTVVGVRTILFLGFGLTMGVILLLVLRFSPRGLIPEE